MGRFNDPQRDENAETLRRRLEAARTGAGPSPVGGRPLLAALIVVGVLGAAAVVLGLL